MEALETLDALMLAAEMFGSAMHVGVVLIFSQPDGADEGYVDGLYTESLTCSLPLDPRLRRHPHRGLDTGGIWMWRDEPEVDLRAHVHRTTLPAGSGTEDLWTFISTLHGQRLEMSVPLWTSHLIDGLADGRFAIYIKVHHIVIDGVGGLRMIIDSLSADPGRRSMPPFYADKTASSGSAARADRHRGLPNPMAAVRAFASAAAAGVDLTRRVAAAELATIAGSLIRDAVVAPLEAPHTRFNTRLGPDRAAAGTALDRDRIRAVRDAAGVTGNDVVTAVIAGALRAWLAGQNELPGRTLIAMCPVSVRPHDDAGAAKGGNQFGLGLCPLGTDVDDPAQRLALIHEAMANIKHQVSRNGPDAMLAVMGPAIGSTVVMPLLALPDVMPPSCNLAISNVPGPPQEMYFNGARLDEIYPVSTAFDGMGLNVTVCSYAGRLQVGYVTDAGIMPDVGALVPLTQQALAELEDSVCQ